MNNVTMEPALSGECPGVSAQIKDINKRCLFIYSYAHTLNLAVKDVCNVVKCLKDNFDTAR